jgi:hypothetical protein
MTSVANPKNQLCNVWTENGILDSILSILHSKNRKSRRQISGIILLFPGDTASSSRTSPGRHGVVVAMGSRKMVP